MDTDSWQVGFYSLTLGFALLFNMSDSVFQVLLHYPICSVKLIQLNLGGFFLSDREISQQLHGRDDAGAFPAT